MGAFDFNSYDQRKLKDKLEYTLDQKNLFKEIDAIPELTGAGVVYIDHKYTIVELRPFKAVCRVEPVNVVLREPPSMMNQRDFAGHLKSSQQNPRESRLVSEASGTVLSCGAAVLGWIVVTGSSAAIPLTAGTSTAITYLSVAAAAASSAQCINGLFRTGAEPFAPQANDWLDSQEWYQNITQALDLISLAGAMAAGAVTLKTVKLLQTSSSKPTKEILKSLTRAERTRLTKEIVRFNNPGISTRALKNLMRSGGVAKRFSNIQISHAIRIQLKDAIGATLSFSGSAVSGEVNALAIGIWEQVDL